MANTFLTISQITYEAAMILKNTCMFLQRCNRQYDNQFAQRGAKIGNVLNIRKPWRPVGRVGPVANFEGINEEFATLTLSHYFGVDMNFSMEDLTLTMDDFRRRYIVPAVTKIANYVDEIGLQLYNQIPWMVGTPGTTPNALLTYTRAGALLTEEGFPRTNFEDMRTLLLAPESMAVIADANRGIFNPQGTISDQNRTGLMSLASGWSWFEEANVTTHTVGAGPGAGGAPQVNALAPGGTALVTSAWGAGGGLNHGDVITIAGVRAVNPQSRVSTGRLRHFVVTDNVVPDGGGNAVVPISPPFIGPDVFGNPQQFQTVDTVLVPSPLITLLGVPGTVSPQNVGFYRDAITLAFADLEMPVGIPAEAKERVSDPDSGISIRLVQYYNGTNDVAGARLDVIFGYCCTYPTGAVRIAA
jgi:hypothetical protein